MTHTRHSLRDFSPGETIEVNGNRYAFVARSTERSHKVLLEYGKQAIVAKVQRQDGTYWALKSFKDGFRGPAIKERVLFAARFADIPGMQAARAEVIVPDSPEYISITTQYPFLEYAIIMPWLPGRTWSTLRYQYKTGELAAPAYPACRKRALSLSTLLNKLHNRSVAHCDICPRNVFVTENDEVALIDFENIFSSSLKPPPWGYPAGQDGYRHYTVPARPDKQWGPHGDLFAGALLIAELITWYDPEVREHSNLENFIEQERLHATDSEPYLVLLDSLKRISEDLATLFSQAWTSKALEDCPSMDAWVIAIANTPDTLPIPAKLPKHVSRRVKKLRKEDTRPKRAQGVSTVPSPSKAHSVANARVTSRRVIRPKGDRKPLAGASKHVKRRVPPGEIKKRRESVAQQNKKVASTASSAPTSSQMSWEGATVTLVVVIGFLFLCALFGYWLSQ